MIFNFDKSDKGFDSIFGGNLNTDIWSSRLPNPSLTDSFGFDPQLKKEFFDQKSNGMSYIGQLCFQNNVSSVRTAMGGIASTLGYLTSEFDNISNVFEVPINKITLKIQNALAILDQVNDSYKDGLNAMGAIPVVGWILGIIVKVAELVSNIIKTVQETNASDAKNKLITQFAIPLAQFSKDADEALTRICMTHIQSGDMNYLFAPRYIYEDFDDFNVIREKNESPDNILTRAFNISSKKSGGIGFIPGTLDINSAIRLLTIPPGSGGGGISDVGDFYPTVRNLCISLFEQIQKPSTVLFSITPDLLSTAWETNIYNMLKYSELSLIKGWSGFQTGEINTDKFLCSAEVSGQLDCKKSKYNNYVKIPITTDPFGHFNRFRDFISNKFFNGKYKEKKLITKLDQLEFSSKNINLKDSIPSQALKNIRDTQHAVMNSIYCCYINDDSQFAAVVNDSKLNSMWTKNLSAVLSSSNEWKKLRYLDIPDGEFKNEILLKAKKAGFKDFENRKGAIDNKVSNMKSSASIFGDFKPPKPFIQVGVSGKLKMKTKSSASKSENNLVSVMAIAAIGGMFLMKK